MCHLKKAATAVAVERTLAFIDRPIDALLIFLVAWWGPIEAFAVGLALELAIAMLVLELHLQTSRRGFDVTGADMVRGFIFSPAQWRFTRAIKLVLRKTIGSYWLMIFVGSIVYIEPDYVTILLKKKEESRLSVFLRVTLPASIWSTAFWIALFWVAIEGFEWTIS